MILHHWGQSKVALSQKFPKLIDCGVGQESKEKRERRGPTLFGSGFFDGKFLNQ